MICIATSKRYLHVELHVDYYCTEIFSPAADVDVQSFDIIGETYKSVIPLITERHLVTEITQVLRDKIHCIKS